MTILVAELDDAAAQLMLDGLKNAGLGGRCWQAKAPGFPQAAAAQVLVADPSLPGLGGLDMVRHLREAGIATPVLFVSALCSAEQRVRGLEAGADDYLDKPYAMAELVARVRALIRRLAPSLAGRAQRVADLVWDPTRRRIERDGQRLELTPKEFAVLTLLLERQGQIVSREELGRILWGGSLERPALRSPNAMDAMIRRLRGKVDTPFARPLIHTCRGQGLILEAREPVAQPSNNTRA